MRAPQLSVLRRTLHPIWVEMVERKRGFNLQAVFNILDEDFIYKNPCLNGYHVFFKDKCESGFMKYDPCFWRLTRIT